MARGKGWRKDLRVVLWDQLAPNCSRRPLLAEDGEGSCRASVVEMLLHIVRVGQSRVHVPARLGLPEPLAANESRTTAPGTPIFQLIGGPDQRSAPIHRLANNSSDSKRLYRADHRCRRTAVNSSHPLPFHSSIPPFRRSARY